MGAAMGSTGQGAGSEALPRAGSAHAIETHANTRSRRSPAVPNAAASSPFQQPPSIGQPPVSMNTNFGATGATAPAAATTAPGVGSGYDGKAAAALLRAERQSKALKTGRADLSKFFVGNAWEELRALERQKRALMDQDVEGKDEEVLGRGGTGGGGAVAKKKGPGSSQANRVAEVRSMKEVYLEALRGNTQDSAAVDDNSSGLRLSSGEEHGAANTALISALISEEEANALNNRGRHQRPEPIDEHSAANSTATNTASPKHGKEADPAPGAGAATRAGAVADLTLQPEHLSLVAKYFGGDEALRDLEATVLGNHRHAEPQPLRNSMEQLPYQPSPLNASPIRSRPLPPATSAASAPPPQPTLTLHNGNGNYTVNGEGGSFTPGRMLTPGRQTPGRQTPGRQTPVRTPLRTPSGGGPGGGSVDALLDWANTLDFDFDDL